MCAKRTAPPDQDSGDLVLRRSARTHTFPHPPAPGIYATPREPSSSAPATLPGIRATSTPEITPAGKQPLALDVTSEQADISGSTRGNREIRAVCQRIASRSSDYTSPPLSLETGNLVRRSPELRRSRRDSITTVNADSEVLPALPLRALSPASPLGSRGALLPEHPPMRPE